MLAALALGAPSLAYAYGRDQAMFHYVAREWLLHGRWPYAQVFETKPPGIFLVYGAGALFGDALWPARLLDLLAVTATGALAGWIAARDRGGAIAAGALAAVGLHYAVFDYWHTAQVEAWVGLGLMIALAAALEVEAPRRAGIGVGAGIAVALVFKVTALPAAAVPLAALAWARWRDRPALRQAFAAAGLTAGASLGAIGLVFALGAGRALGDLVLYLRAYAALGDAPLGASLERFFLTHAVVATGLGAGAALIGAIDRAGDAHWRARLAFGLALLVGSLLGVVWQGRFFLYHFGVLVGPAALVFALALTPRGRLFDASWKAGGAGLVLAITLIVSGPPWESSPEVTYRRFALELAPAAGYDPGAMARVFRHADRYSWDGVVAIAAALRARGPSPEHERLHARGFELPVYVLTGLRTDARFVNEAHFSQARIPEVDAWRRAQEAELARDPPAFFLTFSDRPDDLARLSSRGYEEVARYNMYVLLERPGSRVHGAVAARHEPRGRATLARCRAPSP